MTALNTHLTINLSEEYKNNSVSVSYKPSEFQASTYGSRDKGIDSMLVLGTKSCPLHESLSKLNSLLASQVNIYEHLGKQGLTSVKTELINKKLSVSKLLNSLSYQKLNQIITLLTNSFIKDNDFYDFSLGMLNVVTDKIKTELDEDFIKIKRRIDDYWSANVTIESIEGYSYHGKISSFSFKDNYKIKICDVGVDKLTEIISEMFGCSIKPYTDIYMEKIAHDSFKSIQIHYETSQNIWQQIERIVWELYMEDGSKRHSDSAMYEQLDELVKMYEEKLSESSLHFPQTYGLVKRQVTAAVSFADNKLSNFTKPDYTDFSSYQNAYHYNFLELQKKGLPLPRFMTENEIMVSIARTKRYFSVFRLCETSIASFLEHKDSLTNFESIVVALESSLDNLIDAICLLYNEDSELNF